MSNPTFVRKPGGLTAAEKEIFDSIPAMPHVFPPGPTPLTALASSGRALYRPLTYLACPYTAKTQRARRDRFDAANHATKYLMETEKLNVFSPITHSHPLHEIGMRGDWEFWKAVDMEYLRISEKVVVLMLPGWVESVGVQAEIKIAKSMGIPVEYLDPKKLDL